jgi:hypothetical protein
VHDPRDAEVAADYAGYLERLQAGGRWRTRFVWFEMAYVALGLVLGIVALATGGGAGVFLRLAPLAFIVAGILLRRRLRMRAERARNENARVHGVAR